MTPTATTASCAPPPSARSAARSARVDDPGPRPPRDPHTAGHPPACCAQQTITVPPDVAAKTRQKHDYPSPPTAAPTHGAPAAERTFSTIKDPATTTIARGWCRLTGLAPLALWLACLLAVRNQRILAAWDTRHADNTRRAASGLPPRTRRRAANPRHARRRPALTPPGRQQLPAATRQHPRLPAKPGSVSMPSARPPPASQDQYRPRKPPRWPGHRQASKLSEPKVNMDPGET